jgi:hypothetical protein
MFQRPEVRSSGEIPTDKVFKEDRESFENKEC